MAIPTSDLPGHRGLQERVYAVLDTCIESQSVDFKESASWHALQHKIIRTTLAMANLRDGGIIVIGASERGDRWELTGISDEDLATYEVDEVIDAIHRFASPSVDVRLVLVPYRDSRIFLTLQVFEFADTPVVCRRDGPPNSGLKQGAVYIRPPGVARTSSALGGPDARSARACSGEARQAYP